MKSRVQRARIAATAAAFAVPAVAAAAGAPAVAAERTPETPHCSTMRLTATQLKNGAKSIVHCFATMDESLAAIGVAPLSAAMATSAVVTGLVGIHYKGYQGTGDSLAIGGDNCDGGGISFDNGDPWNDAIRSTQHEGCSKIKHFVDANDAGASQTTTGGVYAYRDLNATLAANVSSIVYLGPAN